MLLDQIEALEGLIARFDERIGVVIAPFVEAAGRLRGIPGVGERAAEVILGEIGPDVEKFPTSGHLSLGGDVPGQRPECREASEREDDQGEPVAALALVQVAWSASHTKETIFSALQRWAKRLGKKKALVAVATRSWW